jgi:hypothetical protein
MIGILSGVSRLTAEPIHHYQETSRSEGLCASHRFEEPVFAALIPRQLETIMTSGML